MSQQELRHTYLTGAWQYCPRCDEKVKIDDCEWQRGLLLCSICVDRMLLGDRELAIAMVLDDGKMELAPVEKLRNPQEIISIEDFALE
jgi:hypothetical protein